MYVHMLMSIAVQSQKALHNTGGLAKLSIVYGSRGTCQIALEVHLQPQATLQLQ